MPKRVRRLYGELWHAQQLQMNLEIPLKMVDNVEGTGRLSEQGQSVNLWLSFRTVSYGVFFQIMMWHSWYGVMVQMVYVLSK